MILAVPAKQKTHRGWALGVHRGEDYGWGSGDQIFAAEDGIVVSIYDDNGPNGGWGNRIRIKHADGAYTTYNHIRPGGILVKLNARVKKGQLIAWMGNTGKSTAKHLHFELELGGMGSQFRVNPAPYRSKHLPGTAPKPITGKPAGGVKPVVASNQRVVRKLGSKAWLNGRDNAYTTAKATQKLEPGVTADFDGWKRGSKVTIDGVTSDIWFRGKYKKKWFAAAGFTSQSTIGLKEIKIVLKPKVTKKNYFKSAANGTYYYHDYANAQNGNYSRKQLLKASTFYEVIENPGRGSVKIKVPGVGNVWVGTRNNKAKVVKK